MQKKLVNCDRCPSKYFTLFLPDVSATFNGEFLLFMCLGPITPAVAMVLFPFTPVEELPPFSVMEDKDTGELFEVLFNDAVGC